MRTWIDNLADWLESPMGGLAAFGLTLVIRGLWPKLSAAARKRVPTTRRKGAKHQHHKDKDLSRESVEPGVGL